MFIQGGGGIIDYSDDYNIKSDSSILYYIWK